MSKIDALDDDCNAGAGKVTRNLKRLQAQRNELNAQGLHYTPRKCTKMTHALAVRELKEELRLLHEPGSYVGEVIKVMSTKKILVKVIVFPHIPPLVLIRSTGSARGEVCGRTGQTAGYERRETQFEGCSAQR